MKLIQNWKIVARTAHSMWAFYASLICLLLPEAIFWLVARDSNPRVWWVAGIVLLIYGILGRLWDQGIDRSKARSPWIVGLLAVILVAALVLGQGHGKGALDVEFGASDIAPDPPSPDQSYDMAFLAAAVPFVARWEGLRLEAYLDIGGVPTICYGETKGVEMGDKYSLAECDAMLAREILAYRNGLRPAFTADTIADRLPLARDLAFTSFAYNVGVSGASQSTAVRRLNKSNISGACQALGWWNKAGGRVVRGLVNRRAEETALCMKGVT